MCVRESLGKREHILAHTREEGAESIFQIILTSILRKNLGKIAFFRSYEILKLVLNGKRHILAHSHKRPGKTFFGVCPQGHHDPRCLQGYHDPRRS
jgi:hypothetical protein